MPSPVCLTSRPPCAVEPAPDQRVVRPNQLERRAVAKPRRHLGRTDDVGEHDGAQPRINRRRGGSRRCARIADSAEERLDRGEIDRHDRVGDLAMRFTMDSLGGGGVGRVDQTEGGAALLVEPIGHVFDPVPVLDVDIPAVGLGDLLCRRAAQVMAVNEDRQTVFLVRPRNCRSSLQPRLRPGFEYANRRRARIIGSDKPSRFGSAGPATRKGRADAERRL